MQTRKEKAIKLFTSNYNCAQSVLGAFCEDNGLDLDTALKLATGFGGGGMRYKSTCGAVSGAIMAIGLKCGHYLNGDIESKRRCYLKVQEFTDKFKEKYDTIICGELLEIDKNAELENELERIKPLFKSVCPEFVKSAVQILENMEF